MIVQGQGQHCAGLYEYKAGSKSEFCPHCGKETFCAPPKPTKAKSTPSSGSAGVMLEIGAVLLFIIGCGMVFDGCTSNLNESLKSEGSAIRQTVYTIQYSLGFTVICLSMILAALVRIIRKP